MSKKPDDNKMQGLMRFQEGKIIKALEHFRKYNASNPNDPFVLYHIGACHYMMKNIDEAIEVLNLCLKFDPKYQDAIFDLGLINFERENYRQAAHYFKKIASKRKDHFDTHLYYGRALMALGQNDKAIKEFEHCLKIKPEDPQTKAFLGMAFYEIGEYKQALEHLELSLFKWGKEPMVHYDLAMVYLKMNRVEEAQREKQLLAELDPAKALNLACEIANSDR